MTFIDSDLNQKNRFTPRSSEFFHRVSSVVVASKFFTFSLGHKPTERPISGMSSSSSSAEEESRELVFGDLIAVFRWGTAFSLFFYITGFSNQLDKEESPDRVQCRRPSL